jgi:hypothetical protein
MNEAMNQSIAKFAPKGRDFSRTGSLHRRIMAAVGTNTGGMHYFSTVLEKIGCCPPPAAQDLFFDTRDHRNEYGFRYKSQPCNKRKRSAENVAKMSVQAKEKKLNPNTEQELRLRLILEPTTQHCPPIQLLLPQLPQARNQRRDAKGVVVRTTNVAAARSVPTTRTGSFHQVSECCV